MEKFKAFLTKQYLGIPVWAILLAIVAGLWFARRVLSEEPADADEVTEEESALLEDGDLLDEGLLNGSGFNGGGAPEAPTQIIRIDPIIRPPRTPCFFKWGMIFYQGDWAKVWVINRGKPKNQKIGKWVNPPGKRPKRFVPIGQAEFSRRNPGIARCLKTKVPATSTTVTT